MKIPLLALAGSLAACATLPVPSDAARELAAAEAAFAAHSVREDMRAAFLAHFAPDGVMVGEGWSTPAALLGPRPAPPIVLEWRPAYVEVAGSGDLGLSTGPWKRTPRAGGEPAWGQFVSIWKREPGGAWRVAVDLGVGHRESFLWEAPLQARRTPGLRATASLPEAEAEFARRAQASGSRAAYAEFGAGDLRLYRPGVEPAAARATSLARATEPGDDVRWVVERWEVAGSGDFGYARGHYSAARDPSKRAGHFLRAWRHEPAGWRIVMDVVDPARP